MYQLCYGWSVRPYELVNQLLELLCQLSTWLTYIAMMDRGLMTGPYSVLFSARDLWSHVHACLANSRIRTGTHTYIQSTLGKFHLPLSSIALLHFDMVHDCFDPSACSMRTLGMKLLAPYLPADGVLISTLHTGIIWTYIEPGKSFNLANTLLLDDWEFNSVPS